MARPLSRHLRGELLAVLALLGAGTALFWATGLDLWASASFNSPCCAWPLAERQPWSFIYRYGVFAGVLLAAAALVVLTLSYWYPARLLHWRRPALFLALVVAVGPGLLVNVVFKDHYGRPRPREVVELGGQERFLPVLVPGSDRQAKSFPCGHCSMGFYLSVPWLVLKRRRPRAAAGFLAAGLVAGGLLGVARMMAGGHFFSDVLWAGGLTWLTAIALYHLLDLDAAPDRPAEAAEAARDRGKARVVTAVVGVLLALLTAAALVATPYVSEKRFTRSPAQLGIRGAVPLAVALDEATVAASAGPGLDVAYRVQAFGFPTSRVGFSWREAAEGDVLSIDTMGWFTERRTRVTLALPAGGGRPLRLSLAKGRLALDLRQLGPADRLEVEVGEGEVRVTGAAALDDGRVRLSPGRAAVTRD